MRIGVHTVALNIDAAEEPVYRNAATLINDTYERYSKHFPNKPVEQIWVYVALAIAVNLQSDARDKEVKPIMDALRELNKRIEETIGAE